MAGNNAMMSRPIQFRLRSVFIAVALVSVWLSVLAHRAHSQRDASAKIVALGGVVYYNYHDVSWQHGGRVAVAPTMPRYDTSLKPRGPYWLRALVGDDFFRTVVAVDIRETSAGDDQIQAFHRALPNAAIRCPLTWGERVSSHTIAPSSERRDDALAVGCEILLFAFAVWVATQYVCKHFRMSPSRPRAFPREQA